MCNMHYLRNWKHNDPLMRKSNANSEGGISSQGYVMITRNGKRIPEHVFIAENAFGKEFSDGVEIHHVNEDKRDNKNSNLVVCENAKYHQLIHSRTRALNISGNANNIKCVYCKKYDSPDNVITNKSNSYHSICRKIYRKTSNTTEKGINHGIIKSV